MFWLCYYNSLDKPVIECAFSSSSLLLKYVKEFIDFDRVKFYTVYCADEYGAITLRYFLQNEKEF